jgi:hypothetical protein
MITNYPEVHLAFSGFPRETDEENDVDTLSSGPGARILVALALTAAPLASCSDGPTSSDPPGDGTRHLRGVSYERPRHGAVGGEADG